MFKRRSANYLSWDEYRNRVAYRERLLFMQDTVLRSLRNHYNKISMGVITNG